MLLQQLRNLPLNYLPDQAWMNAGGYRGMPHLGFYEHQADPHEVYTINVLSQSGLFILRHNDVFKGAAVVTTDEELLRFLSKSGFPLPV